MWNRGQLHNLDPVILVDFYRVFGTKLARIDLVPYEVNLISDLDFFTTLIVGDIKVLMPFCCVSSGQPLGFNFVNVVPEYCTYLNRLYY